MSGFVKNTCIKVYEENTEGRKKYRIYMDNETPKHKTDLADEITQALGINGVYVSVGLTNKEMHLNKLDFSEHDKVFKDKIVSLEKQIEKMQAEKNTLRTRCMESARDNFDNGIYGCLTIVKYPNELETENISLKQKVKEYEDKIAELEKELEEWKEEARVVKKQRDEQLKSFRKGIEPYVDLLHMHETIAELKQRIAELESKETETCEKEPISDDCGQSMEWYENRHQSDCIEINRLNTTIDVLIHKVEYLRQFAGLE